MLLKDTQKYLVAIGLVFLLGACSSSNKDSTGDDTPAEELPAADAGTDAVPADAAANPEAKAAPAPAADAAVPPIAAPDATAPAVAPPIEAAASPAPITPPVEQAAEATPPAPLDKTASADTTTNISTDVASASKSSDTASESVSPSHSRRTEMSGDTEQYAIQPGDTLMKIAFETYGDLYRWRDIYDANRDRISNPNAIPNGTMLKLEKPSVHVSVDRNGDKYLIKHGDTLGTISYDVYGVTQKWRKLWENNRQLIHDPNKIFAGFYLYYVLSPEERDDAEKIRHQSIPAPKPLAAAGAESRAVATIPVAPPAAAVAAEPVAPQPAAVLPVAPAGGTPEVLPQAPVAAVPAPVAPATQ